LTNTIIVSLEARRAGITSGLNKAVTGFSAVIAPGLILLDPPTAKLDGNRYCGLGAYSAALLTN